MEKLDLTKKYKTYYHAKTSPEMVTIEKARFISICGKGDPSEKPFTERIEALYPTAYAIKFAFKEQGKDFVVSKLEGLWWFDTNKFRGKSISNSSVDVPREEWEYRLLIRMPEFVTKQDVEKAIRTVVEKKKVALAKEIEYFEMHEGTCVQMLHVGPFSTEPESLKKIEAFTAEKRLGQAGLYHEIYLSDFRKVKPEKLKTILREPVKELG
ncbi:GyrI-like domain-containing protein [Chryseolinea sp. T2]|uniref:GyrI-like domain-containing protein n=1 Tax=Chryseolinea sp. T2 TaxID=3129255 RepID=UPI003076F181